MSLQCSQLLVQAKKNGPDKGPFPLQQVDSVRVLELQ